MSDSEPDGQFDAPSDMLLIFGLEGESFAIPVDLVNEILDPQSPTPVPNADPFVPGVINVRGVIVPVIDIRYRLDMAPAELLPTSRMIVCEHALDGVPQKLAFMTDSVDEVIAAENTRIEEMPELGAIWPQECIAGAFDGTEGLVVLLDTGALFTCPAPQNSAA